MKFNVGAVVVVGLTVLWAGHATLRAQSPSPSAAPSPSPSPSPAPSPVPDGGVYTKDQAERGKTVYVKLCALCHGDGLAGIDESGPLTGARFIGHWDGKSAGDLVQRIRLTMPPGNPGALTSQESADVVAYILQYNGLPVGGTELPRLAAPLKEIMIKFPAPK